MKQDGYTTAASGATKGALLIQSGTTVRYTPTNASSFGTDSFTYTISDGNGGTATATVSLTYNDKPVAVDDTRSTALNTADVFNSPKNNDTDSDGDTLTVSAVSGATGGTVTRSGNTVTFTPTTGFTGAGGYDYTLNDGRGGTDTGHVTVTVGGSSNVAPVAVTDTKTTAFNTVLNFDPRTNDTDANGDALTITAKTNGAHGTVAITGGGMGLSVTPTTGYSGTDSFTYTISDGSLTSVGTVNMTISAGNAAPVAVDDYEYIDGVPPGVPAGGGPQTRDYYVKANDTDANGDTLTITSVTKISGAATATVAGSGGSTYLHVTGITVGTHIFDYVISDGNDGTDTGRLTIERTWEP